MSILVIDVGTSGVRVAVVDDDGSVRFDLRRPNLPDTPFPGLVEFDATAMAAVTLELAVEAVERARDVTAVGITTQRASTIVWDRATGEPIAPGIGWQDLRTVGDCLVWQAEGHRFSPNGSATKAAQLVAQAGARDDLCIGTVDSWIAHTLSGGALHVTDGTNAGVTELTHRDEVVWNADVCELLGLSVEMLPTIVDSTGVVGPASALPGAPVIAGIAGDQQASLIGQGCVRPGLAKITFGTGGMLDVCVGETRPAFDKRSEHGTFPIVAWMADGSPVWGVEAIMLAAGSNVEWLRDDLGLISDAAASHTIASSVASTEGVVYVPAPLGLGTPNWDFGARGTLLGLTRGSTGAHVVRAVLEGVAQRGADLVEAAEADTDLAFETLRVDGGMSVNPTFTQALADACGRPIELAVEAESTTLGAAYLAGMATGIWSGWDEIASLAPPRTTVEPSGAFDREQWKAAVTRSTGWFPDLSAIDF